MRYRVCTGEFITEYVGEVVSECEYAWVCTGEFITEYVGEVVSEREYAWVCTGEFITEYVGEVVSEREFRRRMTEQYCNERHHYCVHLDSGVVIDGYRMGNVSRLINHSCQPNCEMQKW